MSLAQRLKRTFSGGRPAIPEAVSAFVGMERLYRTPPLTDEFVSAIHLIAPNCSDYRPTPRYRDFWEQYQNAASWAEYRALEPILGVLPTPRRVLELGPGLGRSLVFFTKKLGWQNVDIHALEGNGTSTKYTKLGPRYEDSFCGNIKILTSVLEYNGIKNVSIHDAATTSLKELPGTFDLLYSFYSIGFHWSLEYFLDDLLALMDEKGTAIFTVPPSFEISLRLAELPHRLLPLHPSAAKANSRDNLFVLRKSAFPGGPGLDS
jgi:SAM-dependent methyltransferase